jgi:hypothetical protein
MMIKLLTCLQKLGADIVTIQPPSGNYHEAILFYWHGVRLYGRIIDNGMVVKLIITDHYGDSDDYWPVAGDEEYALNLLADMLTEIERECSKELNDDECVTKTLH